MFQSSRKRFRSGEYTDIEEALFKWFTLARSAGVPITGPVLATKAESLAEKLGCINFKALNGFIERFKERRGIVYKNDCGKSNAVNCEIVQSWKEKLPSLIEQCLFYKLQPDKSLHFKGESCSGGKKSKERITVMLVANMSGTNKLKPLLIRKFKNPRCVKSLPVDYEANGRAWMTSDLFETWARKVDKQMRLAQRHILLFIDNCPAHPELNGLTNIELMFLPPNTTSHLQPCD